MRIWFLLAVLVCCFSAFAGQPENRDVYDGAQFVCRFPMPEQIRQMNPIVFTWQLLQPGGRILMQGKINTPTRNAAAEVPLEFERLDPGVKMGLVFQAKLNGDIVFSQPLTVHSRQIFSGRVGQAGAMLPDEMIGKLESMGLKLENLSDFSDEIKLMLVEASSYAENPGLLASLMDKGVTLVMFTPGDETEIQLPQAKIREIRQIFPSDAKIGGSLNVISGKEKTAIHIAGGGLIEVNYRQGKIIIVSDALREALDKTPGAALMLISSMNLNNQRQEKKP